MIERVKEYPGLNGNAYSFSKRLYCSIKVTKDKVIETSYDLNEAVAFELDKEKTGGMIILSTDVNAVKQAENKFVDWVKKKAYTLSNRVSYTKKIDKVAQKNKLLGWTIGKFLDGRYTSKKGVPFGENSLSVDLAGIDTDTLIEIATELCKDFRQETVLVKDYNTGKIYFVDGE